MKFRSTKRRGIAALASSAVVLGVLATPTLLAAPAQAAADIDGVAYSCTGAGPNPVTYTTDVDFSAVWDKASGRALLSAELGNFPNGAPGSGTLVEDMVQNSTLNVTLPGTPNPTAVTLTGTRTADFNAGETIDVPTVSALTGAKAESLSVTLGSFKLELVGAMTLNCSLPTPAPAAVTVPITFPTGSDLNFVCSFGANKFGYQTDAAITAKQNGANVDVTATLEPMPNTAPGAVQFLAQDITAKLGATVGASATTLTGTHKADFKGGVAVTMPVMKGSFATVADPISIAFGDIEVAVGALATIPCTLAAPATMSVGTGPTPACTSAQAQVTAAQAVVTAETAKVAKVAATAQAAKAKVAKAAKAVKKAKAKSKAKLKKAKKKLKAAKKAAAGANAAWSLQNKKLAAAKTALANANKAVAANC